MSLPPVRRRGVAMVVVLWIISLLTIMAASFSLSIQRNTGLVKNAEERAQDLALADAGVHYVMLMLAHPDPLRRWRSNGDYFQARLPDGVVGLVIQDESGKLDLNAASEHSLQTLIAKLTGNEDLAKSLTDKILDWRDGDNLKRLNGAEDKDYLAAGKPYVPQNKNFQALEELQMVLGITPALYKRLEPFLTLYTGQDGINPFKASKEALVALFGLDEKTADDYLSLRRNTPPNAPQPPLSVPPGEMRAVGGGDVAYTVHAQSRTGDGVGAGLKVVMRRQVSRNNGAPFTFVSWKQQVLAGKSPSEVPAHMPR